MSDAALIGSPTENDKAVPRGSSPSESRVPRPATGARKFAAAVAGILLLLAIWAIGGWLITRDPATASFAGLGPLPAFTKLFSMLSDGSISRAVLPSLSRVLGGLFFAVLLGTPVGILIGGSPAARELTNLPFQLLRMISPLAWMPVAIIAFNTWDKAIIFLIAAASIWPVIFATASGLQKIDPDWFKVAHNLGARGWHILTVVILPAIAHDMLTGIRLALGVAWIVLVPAEYLGVTNGLGYAINDARDTLEYDRLAALIVVIGLIGFALDSFLQFLIRRFAWSHRN